MLYSILFDIVHKQTIAIAGDVVKSIGTFLYIIATETFNGRFHVLHQVQYTHIAIGWEHVEYAGAVAHKVVVVVGQSFHQCPSVHVIFFGGSCRAQFGVHHNRLVVGHNHPTAVPLETGCYHFYTVHIGMDVDAAQFAPVLIKGVNKSGVGKR